MAVCLLALAPMFSPGLSAQYADPSAFSSRHAEASPVAPRQETEKCAGRRLTIAIASTAGGAVGGYLGYLLVVGLIAPNDRLRNAFVVAGTVFGALYGGLPALFSDCEDLPPRRRRPR